MSDRNACSEATFANRPERLARYEKPTVEVISLACEISAYAPDEDDSPLF